jgi:hypothetical protein
MKSLLVGVVSLLVICFASCVRRHQCKSHLRVKTVYNAMQGITSTYFYKDGTLSSITTTNGSKTYVDYSDKVVNGKTMDKNGVVTSTWTCFLNSRGLVDSMVRRDSANITLTKHFLYDDKGFAIEEQEYKPGEPYSITHKLVSNGDIMSFSVEQVQHYTSKVTFNPVTKRYDTLFITAKGKEYTVYNEYYPEKQKTLAFENYGSAEFGEGAKNIEKRTVQVSANGDTIEVSTFNYDFDKEGRVTKCVTYSQTGELIDSDYISYY